MRLAMVRALRNNVMTAAHESEDQSPGVTACPGGRESDQQWCDSKGQADEDQYPLLTRGQRSRHQPTGCDDIRRDERVQNESHHDPIEPAMLAVALEHLARGVPHHQQHKRCHARARVWPRQEEASKSIGGIALRPTCRVHRRIMPQGRIRSGSCRNKVVHLGPRRYGGPRTGRTARPSQVTAIGVWCQRVVECRRGGTRRPGP